MVTRTMILSKPANGGYSLKTLSEYWSMCTTAEDIWSILVCHPIGTLDELISQMSSGVPGAEFARRMYQMYSIYVVLLRRYPGASRIVRSCLGG